jgi:glucose/mannose-6-phosphate isomerase
MPHPVLDNVTECRALDPSGMTELLTRLPGQFSESVALAAAVGRPKWPSSDLSQIIILGMGGSAIGGDLVRSHLTGTLPLPLQVVRDYRLPHYASPRTLVIASSYSGNTEETLAAVDVAHDRGCPIIALSSGGTLADKARAHDWPLVRLPGGFPPRAALGYSFSSLLLLLSTIGLVADPAPALHELAGFLMSRNNQLAPEIPFEQNPAKQLAAMIKGRIPVIYGAAGAMSVAALRWKGQFCENAKNLAWAGEAPEFNHNEVVGWGLPKNAMDILTAVFLRSADDHPRIARRFEIVRKLFTQQETPVEMIDAAGDNPLQRLFSIIQLGDWTSLYLAFLNGVDPTTITAIHYLKTELGKVGD